MFRQRLRFLFSPQSLKVLSGHFVAALGTQWLILEVVSFFFKEGSPVAGPDFFIDYRPHILLAFLVPAFAWTLYRSFPRFSYSRRSREANVEVEVKVGDLFAVPGNVAIGCSDCFDTEAPASVDPKSLIAQLVKRSYGNQYATLDQLIGRSLADGKLTGTADASIERGKKERFPIGTVAVVSDGSRKIFLTVFSKAKPDKATDTTQEDLWISLSELWKVVRREGGLEPITVPVWGSGMARFHASRITLIQIVLLSFVIAARERPVSRKLTLVIHGDSYDPEEMAEAIQLIDTLDF